MGSTMEIIVFIMFVAVLLTVDLAYHKELGSTFVSALVWSGVYVVAALMFAGFLAMHRGAEAAGLFLTGYTLEKVLAFDNLFVFSLIFSYFNIHISQQHKALHYGIIGAIVFRLIFTAIGVEFMDAFGPAVDMAFAAMIIYSCVLMLRADEDPDYDNIWWVIQLRKIFPKLSVFVIAVIVLEVSDILFAFDSVPAIIAVTKDPFLIYASMIFAILGLRQMYFLIAAASGYLEHLDKAVFCILGFIAFKLIAGALFDFHLAPYTSLGVIVAMLAVGVGASYYHKVNR